MDWKRAGAAVRRARAAVYGSRADFAHAIGLSVSVLGELERGVRSNFDIDTLGRVEDALGWEPGTITAVAAGGQVRRVDPDLTRLQQAWPHLSRDGRQILADLAERIAERRGR